jgi:hypothetical protein
MAGMFDAWARHAAVKHSLRRLPAVALATATATAAVAVAAAVPAAAVPTAAVSTPVVPAAAVPAAQAASTPSWKIVKTYPVGEGVAAHSAVSTTDVWAAGEKCTDECQHDGLMVARWNGGSWQTMPTPAGIFSATVNVSSDAIAATSPSNAWLFAGQYAPSTHKSGMVAVHWTGRSWTKPMPFPVNGALLAAVAPSASNFWVFIQQASGRPYAARYNGSTWKQVSIPAAPTAVSAISATDIWGTGNGTLEHWNGTAWKSVALPHFTVPSGYASQAAGIVAFDPNNVWAEFGVYLRTEGGGPESIVLAHLTSSGWSVFKAPSSLTINDQLPQDLLAGNTKAGVWFVARQTSKSGTGKWVFVRVAGKTFQPEAFLDGVFIDSMVAVPGSGSLLAFGALQQGQPDFQGVVLGYGSL